MLDTRKVDLSVAAHNDGISLYFVNWIRSMMPHVPHVLSISFDVYTDIYYDS